MNTPEVEELKSLIEHKFGRALSTTSDFVAFSYLLKHSYELRVSASTLKRLWGYVHDNHKPRLTTLNTLACYLGYANFLMFCQWLKTSKRYNSSFFHARQLSTTSLDEGSELQIGWKPNRLVHLRYLGDSVFEVLRARNSKLAVGDRFMTGGFIIGQPLCVPFVVRKGRHTSPFVAGRNGGLTVIEHVEEAKPKNRKNDGQYC